MSFKLEKGEPTIILKHKMNVTVPVEIAPNEMNQIRDKINEDLRRLMDLAILRRINITPISSAFVKPSIRQTRSIIKASKIDMIRFSDHQSPVSIRNHVDRTRSK